MTEITDVESLVEYLKGSFIVGGGKADDGMHFELSNGSTIVFVGQFVVGVIRGQEENIH